MTDDRHGEGTPPGGSRWDPLPQGDYDDGATAFVNLPEGGIDALLDAMESPLAAPGHGYVPPQITVSPTSNGGTDPAATGSWGVPGAPVDGAQWHDPQAGAAPGDRFTYDPAASGQWAFEDGAAENPAPGHDVTGQWSIPVADGDLPDESGEFTASSLVEQWGGTPPPTLPGGAPAPWAHQDIGRPWGPGVPGVPQDGDDRRPGGHGPAPDHREPGPSIYADGPGSLPHPDGDPYGGRPLPAAEPLPPTEPARPEDPAFGPEGYPARPAARHPHGGPEDGPEGYGGQPGTDHASARHPHGGPEDGPEGYCGQPATDPAPARHPHGGPDDGPETYGGQPATDPASARHPHGGPETYGGQSGTGVAPEASGAPGHAPARHPHGGVDDGPETYGGQSGADVAPGASGASGRAPARHPHGGPDEGPDGYGGQPAQDGPRPVGVSQPLPGEGHAEPRWQPGADTAEGAPAGHREDPHPGAQDAARPTSGADEASGVTEGAHEAAEGPSEPSDGPSGTAPDPATGAAADGASNTVTPPGTSDDPDDTGEPVATDATDGPPMPHDDHPLASYVLRVNGTDRPVTDAWIGESLLYVLRERLGLAGAKDGCSQGECGACNVQVDGRLVASCLVPAVTAAGNEVRTVEGLAQDGRPSDVQRALARCGAVQCGFCVPGMAMTVHNLLEGNPAPTELETRQALCGNLCRCSGYRGVVDAVKEVVAEREAYDEDDADGEADPPRIPHQAGPGAGGVNPSAFGVTGPGDQPQDQPYDQSHGQDGGQA
ncbi:2Fe-2S iron-sulfur cluster-binding protein [Streptomyces fungicidicus]|uniref:2Fe-2S iron-sulfur cluster-binding protein n=1 Tax=Streptomyces fungicidicus TaxID=68203 RepID=UPI0033C5F2FD